MQSRTCVIFDTSVALCLGLALVLAPILSGPMRADEKMPGPATNPCTSKEPRENLWPRPKYAEARPVLHVSDEVAALEALHLALTEVGDGSSYVWQRRNGELSGVVQPTASFKDANGRICRHIVLLLSSQDYSKRTEGIACRLSHGAWQLEG
jgi:17 kDa outer membrane surface antigen